MELLGFRGFSQRTRRRLSVGNGLRDLIEISCADKALVAHSAVAGLLGQIELPLLQFSVCCHAFSGITTRQIEHGKVESVEAGERDELKLVSHGAQLPLELRDGCVVELLFPVE